MMMIKDLLRNLISGFLLPTLYITVAIMEVRQHASPRRAASLSTTTKILVCEVILAPMFHLNISLLLATLPIGSQNLFVLI